MTTIILPYPPSVNRYWRHGQNGRVYKTPEAHAYAEEAGWLAKAAGVRPTSADVALTIRLYRPRKNGDLDNYLKCAIDALNGIAYDDDRQIVELHAFRFDDPEEPRIEVELFHIET